MRVEVFDMVRMQCAYERMVDYDLSGSGIPPPKLSELIESDEAVGSLLELPQGYPPGGGSAELRSKIAAMYGNASPDHVLVTNGATEANFLGAWRLFEKGDEVVIMVPNYLQTWNLAKSWGLKIRPLPLRENLGWQFDPEDLKSLISKKTRAIQVCNPNNPTGAVIASEQRRVLLDSARDSGAWLLSDEVYVGAEREGPRTESLWGHYDRTLVTNGLCKAYGLPGLRIGWLVGMPDALGEITSYHDYLTLTHATLCDRLAQVILEPTRRERILAQNQAFIRESYGFLRDWIGANNPRFSHRPPTAGPMCFIRYSSKVCSSIVAERLRKEASVLVVPGDLVGMDGYLRIGTGLPKDYLCGGLGRIDEFLKRLNSDNSV